MGSTTLSHASADATALIINRSPLFSSIQTNKSEKKMNFFTKIKFLLGATFLIVLNPGLARARTLQISTYDSIIAPTNRNFLECTGSLIIETPEGEEKRFEMSKRRTLIRARNVRVEGCGCFHVYK